MFDQKAMILKKNATGIQNTGKINSSKKLMFNFKIIYYYYWV